MVLICIRRSAAVEAAEPVKQIDLLGKPAPPACSSTALMAQALPPE
jgi:hypothetical protein